MWLRREHQEGSGQNRHMDEDRFQGNGGEVDWVRTASPSCDRQHKTQMSFLLDAHLLTCGHTCVLCNRMQLKRALELPTGVVLGYQVHSDAMKSRSTSGAKHRYEV